MILKHVLIMPIIKQTMHLNIFDSYLFVMMNLEWCCYQFQSWNWSDIRSEVPVILCDLWGFVVICIIKNNIIGVIRRLFKGGIVIIARILSISKQLYIGYQTINMVFLLFMFIETNIIFNNMVVYEINTMESKCSFIYWWSYSISVAILTCKKPNKVKVYRKRKYFRGYFIDTPFHMYLFVNYHLGYILL